jgi:hypothetical protein
MNDELEINIEKYNGTLNRYIKKNFGKIAEII